MLSEAFEEKFIFTKYYSTVWLRKKLNERQSKDINLKVTFSFILVNGIWRENNSDKPSTTKKQTEKMRLCKSRENILRVPYRQ